MRANELIGYKSTFSQFRIDYPQARYNAIRDNLIKVNVTENSLRLRFHELIKSLNLNAYNNLNVNYMSHCVIWLPIIG